MKHHVFVPLHNNDTTESPQPPHPSFSSPPQPHHPFLKTCGNLDTCIGCFIPAEDSQKQMAAENEKVLILSQMLFLE